MKDTTQLLVVRHGQTQWNVAHRIQGHLDSTLTVAGFAQARAVAEKLVTDSWRPQAIVSSDLGRAMDTARATAARLNLAIEQDSRLRERHLGVFQNCTFDEATAAYPEYFAKYKDRVAEFVIPGGESLLDLRARVHAAIEDIAARYVGASVMIVTHGGVLDQIYRLARDISVAAPRDFEIDNASVNRLTWRSGKLTLVQWGDVSHHPPSTEDEF